MVVQKLFHDHILVILHNSPILVQLYTLSALLFQLFSVGIEAVVSVGVSAGFSRGFRASLRNEKITTNFQLESD